MSFSLFMVGEFCCKCLYIFICCVTYLFMFLCRCSLARGEAMRADKLPDISPRCLTGEGKWRQRSLDIEMFGEEAHCFLNI